MKYLESGGNADLVRNLEVDALGVLITILTILGIPLVLGITFNTKFPKLTDKITVWMKRFSILAFASIMIIIFASNFDLFTKYIQYIFLIVLLHNAAALSVGFFSAKSMGLDKRDCKTIAIETGIQNSALALALLFNPSIFPQDQPLGGMAFIAAWWGVWHILSGLTIAGIWSGFSLKSNREAAVETVS